MKRISLAWSWAIGTNVIITDENIEEQLQEALKQPLNTTLQLAHLEGTGTGGETAETNSLWLQINIRLKKIDEDQLLSNRTFQIEGSSLLLDMKFHRPLSAGEYAMTTQTYSTSDVNAMSSALASYIYRQPLSDLKNVPRELARMTSGERIAQIVIEGAPHIGFAQDLMASIVDKGLSQRLSATLKESNPHLTGFYLNFNGESEKLLALLRSFNNTDFTSKYIVTLPVFESSVESSEAKNAAG